MPLPHSQTRRLAERFALIAFGLYHLPLFLNNYPSLGGGSGGFSEGLAVSWGHIFTRPGIWLARILFGMTGPMTMASAGDNGDVGEEFARLILSVAIGVILAIVWTMADRRRPGGAWVEGALRVLLRYSIALGLVSYAVAKLLPVQFSPLGPLNYETRVGELTPMGLLWTFMRYSRPYSFFGGLMEAVAIVLLCFRGTATLGALVTIAVMTNVALMNISYDVQVKLYATMIVISAGVLVLYDARRLLAVFVTNRSVAPASQPTILEGRMPESLRWAMKLVLVGSVTASSVAAFRSISPASGAATNGIGGPWGITSFRRDANPANATPSPQWRRVIIDDGSITVRLDDDTMMRCRRTPGPDASMIAFTCGKNRTGELRSALSGTQLQLEGTIDGAKVTMAARRLDDRDYPLMRGGVHVIYDRK
ncbi:MAG TPA: hypothetical protein VMZ90_12475 [Vicinamibacterales bacterium]|nr:hypothetical protein [Vicinamibacterales bacterium]